MLLLIHDFGMNFFLPHVGLSGVLWVLSDLYINVKNKDYGGWFFMHINISVSHETARL